MGISWVWPPPSNSDQHNYDMFSRGSLKTFISHWVHSEKKSWSDWKRTIQFYSTLNMPGTATTKLSKGPLLAFTSHCQMGGEERGLIGIQQWCPNSHTHMDRVDLNSRSPLKSSCIDILRFRKKFEWMPPYSMKSSLYVTKFSMNGKI